MRKVPNWVKDYIGIPYLAKGITKEGMDCLGLLELIYKEQFGITLPLYPHLHTDNNMKVVSENIAIGKEDWKRINKPEQGCVVLLKIAGYPVHLGVVLNEKLMVHSLKGHNSVVESFMGSKWKNRIDGFYRYG